MAYRRTEKVQQRLAARHAALIAAARALAAEGGMDAVQIAPVAERAGIAAGTVYRYFPSKVALVEALVADVSAGELAAMQAAAAAAPGPLSALAATIVGFAARALRQRRLIRALTVEPVDPETDHARLPFRQALVGEIAARLAAARERDQITGTSPALAAPAIVAAILEGLMGSPGQNAASDEGGDRTVVQELALFALRAVGIVDARARGLVVQAPWPRGEGAGAVAAEG